MEAVLSLPPELESVRCARRFLDDALRQAGVTGDLAWDVALVAHELVTNAVQHARTDFQLRVAVWGDAVHLEVRDDNPRRPTPARPPRWASSGRGLELVTSLADDWGVEADDVSKVVWAVVRRAGAHDRVIASREATGRGARGRQPGAPPPHLWASA